jgi:DNA-binding transcriptional regulator YhcF (GntR family)
VIVTVDPGGPQPPYEQIRVQVLEAVSSGSLPAGVRLPTIRQLAVDLDLAANTVARAYRARADGVIETEVDGRFVCEHSVAEVGSATAALGDRASVLEARRLQAPLVEAIARALGAVVS